MVGPRDLPKWDPPPVKELHNCSKQGSEAGPVSFNEVKVEVHFDQMQDAGQTHIPTLHRESLCFQFHPPEEESPIVTPSR